MIVDETFKGVNRVWEEFSVIVVIHAVALGLAICSRLIPLRIVTQGVRALASLPELSMFRENLEKLGLDLPLVVGTGCVIYVVLFQRISAAVMRLPGLKLFYSQPALWRAGKCFDELKQLARWSEGYTASTGLTDLEVSLGLAITEYAKDYKEHFQALVNDRIVAAQRWARYYSGFVLLAVIAGVFVIVSHPTKRAALLPAGLLVAAFLSRCGWEGQTERAVLGRLRFAVDCAIVSGVKKREEAEAKEREIERKYPGPNRGAGNTETNAAALEDKRIMSELQLAAEFLMLPPPFFPYQYFWGLHYVRSFLKWPFGDVGCLPLIRNDLFRKWFIRSVRLRFVGMRPPLNGEEHVAMETELRSIGYQLVHLMLRFQSAHDPEVISRMELTGERLVRSIDLPKFVPDDRLMARFLRRSLSLATWSAPTIFLVDEPGRYRVPQEPGEEEFPRDETLREWIARENIQRWQ